MALTRFAATAAPEVRALAAAGAVALWPVGSTEQHGTHLVTGFDLASATAVCERAATTAETSVVLLPGLAFGASDHWLPLGATLSLRPATLLAVLLDVVRSVERSGFQRLVAVNGHAGNVGPLAAALGDTQSAAELQVEVVSYWTLVDQRRLAEACRSDGGGIGHAGEIETSIALALDTGLAVADRLPAPPGRRLRPGEPGGPPAGGIVRSPRPLVESPTGVYGDPTHARPELGELVLSEASEALARHLDRADG
jgi:creatinine amidohydrolase